MGARSLPAALAASALLLPARRAWPAGDAAVPPAVSTAAPFELLVSTAPAVSPEKQRTLVEMRRRRILPAGADQWESEDLELLKLMREAESLSAFELLRDRVGTLRGFAVEHEVARGDRRLWLTKAGFHKYVFLVSQNARRYFETRGTDAKFVFQLRELGGKRLFDGRGILTPAGSALYHRILRGERVQWKTGSGGVTGNFKPDAAPAPPR